MGEATFRFYAELNDFLPAERRQRTFPVRFDLATAVKDWIEALGVPHTEVDLILANGETVDFAYRVQDGDRIAVYPVWESLDIAELARVRPEPLRESRFVCDVHLGRLAAYLRMLGFDTLYERGWDDAELARLSAGPPPRILLSRDRGLLKRSAVTHGYSVRESDPREQLREVVGRFELRGSVAPFTRCIRCNGPLVEASKETVRDRLPGRTAAQFDEFGVCAWCGQVFWKGSHHDRMVRLIEWALSEFSLPLR